MFNHLRGWALTVIAILAGAYSRLFRRIEDARTPVAIWDDPRLTDDRVVAAARASRWPKPTAPRRA
ncbi:hypothetical protein [Streptomyces sp. NPDC054834]